MELSIEQAISEKHLDLFFVYKNRVCLYKPVDCRTLSKGDIIANYDRPFAIGCEKLEYRGQLNEHEDYFSLLCLCKSGAFHTDENGLVWVSFEKEKRRGMYIFLLKDIAIAYKLSQEHNFETTEEAQLFWRVCIDRQKQLCITRKKL